MIFITVGTTNFDNLIQTVDNFVEQDLIQEECLAQIGTGSYVPKNLPYFRFASSLSPYYKKAELIISHGGALTIFECLALKKKLVVVDNPKVRRGHQWELPRELSIRKHLLWCKTFKYLLDCINNAKNTHFDEYISPECLIPNEIVNFLL